MFQMIKCSTFFFFSLKKKKTTIERLEQLDKVKFQNRIDATHRILDYRDAFTFSITNDSLFSEILNITCEIFK